MKRTVTAEATYPHPPARVWHAISDSGALAEWLMENDFRPEVGAEFTMTTKPAPRFDGTVRGVVTECDPPRRLAYTWVGGPIDTLVTFTLTPTDDGGTHLQLTHSGFQGPWGVMTSFILGGGWTSGLTKEIPAILDAMAPGTSASEAGD